MTPRTVAGPHARCFGCCWTAAPRPAASAAAGSEATLLLIVNAHHDVVVFTLPEVTGGRDWLRSSTPTCPTRTRIWKRPSLSLSGTAMR